MTFKKIQHIYDDLLLLKKEIYRFLKISPVIELIYTPWFISDNLLFFEDPITQKYINKYLIKKIIVGDNLYLLQSTFQDLDFIFIVKKNKELNNYNCHKCKSENLIYSVCNTLSEKYNSPLLQNLIKISCTDCNTTIHDTNSIIQYLYWKKLIKENGNNFKI